MHISTRWDDAGGRRSWGESGLYKDAGWDLVQGWNKADTNGSRDFIVIGKHFERGQVVVKWRTNNGHGFDQALRTKMTANDDVSRKSTGDEVRRKPVWEDYAKVQ